MKSTILNLVKKLLQIQIIRFFLTGAISALVDWTIFFGLVFGADIYYQFSLIISFFFAATTNYTINKIFTFKCSSKHVAGQFSTFIMIALTSLLLSVGIMFIFVDMFLWHKMLSKIIVTFMMFTINYSIHKLITFNNRIFK